MRKKPFFPHFIARLRIYKPPKRVLLIAGGKGRSNVLFRQPRKSFLE